MTTRPECFGVKRCPKAPNNTARVWCPLYDACLNELVLRDLVRARSPKRIAQYLRGFLHDSDYLILWRIGTVASANGFLYGRKKVDSTIDASEIAEDGESASLEAREIRRAFGVFGREGARRARSVPRGRTDAPTVGTECGTDVPADTTRPSTALHAINKRIATDVRHCESGFGPADGGI